MVAAYGVADRVELVTGDMFRDPLPADCDVVLLSNILHDWDVPECQSPDSAAYAEVLPNGGRLLIHDVFLNDALDGPLPIALYSAALFSFTEGRAYSRCGRIPPVASRAGLSVERRRSDAHSLRHLDGDEGIRSSSVQTELGWEGGRRIVGFLGFRRFGLSRFGFRRFFGMGGQIFFRNVPRAERPDDQLSVRPAVAT